MAESIVVTGAADTWLNADKPRERYGSTNAVSLLAGKRYGLVRPALPNILGRTIVSATLYGHARAALDAQTITYRRPVTHWTQGQRWSNQPAVDAASGGTVTIAATPAGGLVAMNVAADLQAVADGTAEYHGWRLSTNAATGQWFRSTQSGEPAWELHVTVAADSDEPSNPRPDGGAVGSATPILAWEFPDQQAYQVQVDTPTVVDADPDEVTPDYDSGWVTHPDPQHDLAAAVYTPPASPVGPTYWRVRARDTDGNESDWMPWADFNVAALPVLVVDSPTGAVGDPRVTVLAHLATGTVASWEVWATGPDRADVRHRSGVQDGDVAYEVPAKNKDRRRIFVETEGGWLYLRVHDDVDRAVAVGEQTYTESWIPVEFAPDGTLVAPTGLQVTQYAPGDPRLVWSWSITSFPDGGFKPMVDGDSVETLDVDDLEVISGRYVWVDSGHVPPYRPHTLGVAAIWGGKASAPAEARDRSHAVSDVWLFPDDEAVAPIRLAGKTGPETSQSDRVATYTPVKGDDVDITYDHEGMRGTFKGGISAETHPNPDEMWAALDQIEALRKSKTRTARMVWGSRSIVVRLRHPGHTPHASFTGQNLRHGVSFEFTEVG